MNHGYKDTVFTKYFGNKEKAVELYNALYHKELPDDVPVQMITLDDALFVKRKNDVEFVIDGHFLIFVEGEIRGEAKKEKVLILNMHKEGCTLELIAKITHKGIEEIKAIIAGQDT